MAQYLDSTGLQYMIGELNNKIRVMSEEDFDVLDNPALCFNALLPQNFEVGDYIFWNRSAHRFEGKNLEELEDMTDEDTLSSFMNSRTLIGVCAVPTSANIYGDGSALMVALSNTDGSIINQGMDVEYDTYPGDFYNAQSAIMLASSPSSTAGGWSQYIQTLWDEPLTSNAAVWAGFTQGTAVCTAGNPNQGWIASDIGSRYVMSSTGNSEAGYDPSGSATIGTSARFFICPFTDNGQLNQYYWSPKTGNITNYATNTAITATIANLDIAGYKENRYCILDTDANTIKTDWKIDPALNFSAVYNYNNSPDVYYGHGPEMAVYRFRTTGTKYGDWYIPSLGEAICIMANIGKIDSALDYSVIENTDMGDDVAEIIEGYAYPIRSHLDTFDYLATSSRSSLVTSNCRYCIKLSTLQVYKGTNGSYNMYIRPVCRIR